MEREMLLIQERNNNNEPPFVIKVFNFIRCKTNKTQTEINFERITAKRNEYLKSHNIIESA
jgi:hypothetical protein